MRVKKDIDLINRVFGYWHVDSRAENKEYKRSSARYWHCSCKCGTKRTVKQNALLSGDSKSCGCFKNEDMSRRFSTHRMSDTPEYLAWYNMKKRCLNPNATEYESYGGRGITVCESWINSFESFYTDLGPKPEPKRQYSLDRIDNNGNYEPGNVRWASMREQMRNRSRNLHIEYKGKIQCAADWLQDPEIQELNISVSTICRRFNKGWSGQRIFTTPSSRFKRNCK